MIGCLARLARPSHAWTPSLLPFPPNPFRHFAAILLLCSRRRAIGNGRFIARLDFGSAHRGSANNCCPNIVLPSRALHVCFGPERDVAWDYNPQAEATGNHVDTVRASFSFFHDCSFLSDFVSCNLLQHPSHSYAALAAGYMLSSPALAVACQTVVVVAF